MKILLVIAAFCLASCATPKESAKATNPSCVIACKAEVHYESPKENDDAP